MQPATQKWAISVGGCKKFDTQFLRDIDMGWSRWLVELDRPERRKPITVFVKQGCLDVTGLPPQCKQTIETEGISAIRPSLGRDVPPRYITVTEAGLYEEDFDDEAFPISAHAARTVVSVSSQHPRTGQRR
jgi:hypothetical protein